MSAAADTYNNENVLTQKKGNHKGCPYQRLAGVIFRGIVHVGCRRHLQQ